MGVRVLVMVWSDLSSIATGQVRDVHNAKMTGGRQYMFRVNMKVYKWH